MATIQEECLEDGVISTKFLKAVRTKGSKLYVDSVIGAVKLTKSQFNPMVGCVYIIETEGK